MNQRLCRVCVVFSVVLSCSVVSSAATFNFSVSCGSTTLGPTTVDLGGGNSGSGTITLAPNVSTSLFAPGVTVTSGGVPLVSSADIRIDNNTVTSGAFTGTRQCSLTLGGVTVNYSQSLSLPIFPAGGVGPCAQTTNASGCLTVGPVTVTINLGAQGTVVLSANSNTSLGYQSNIFVGGFIIMPSNPVSGLFTPTPPTVVPVSPSLLLVLTGLAAAGLYQARRKRSSLRRSF